MSAIAAALHSDRDHGDESDARETFAAGEDARRKLEDVEILVRELIAGVVPHWREPPSGGAMQTIERLGAEFGIEVKW